MIHFNIKVDILRITKAPGAMGSAEVANVLHNNLPCRINWKQGREKMFFDKETHFRDAKLFCRMIDITNKDRVRYNSKVYQIADNVNVDEANRLLVLNLKLIE